MKRALRILSVLQEAGKPRYAVGELQPLLQPLLTALFAAFRLPESGENEYLMKAVMRVIAYVGPEVPHPSCSSVCHLHECSCLVYFCVEACHSPCSFRTIAPQPWLANACARFLNLFHAQK